MTTDRDCQDVLSINCIASDLWRALPFKVLQQSWGQWVGWASAAMWGGLTVDHHSLFCCAPKSLQGWLRQWMRCLICRLQGRNSAAGLAGLQLYCDAHMTAGCCWARGAGGRDSSCVQTLAPAVILHKSKAIPTWRSYSIRRDAWMFKSQLASDLSLYQSSYIWWLETPLLIKILWNLFRRVWTEHRESSVSSPPENLRVALCLHSRSSWQCSESTQYVHVPWHATRISSDNHE